jgi:hypothetical protein
MLLSLSDGEHFLAGRKEGNRTVDMYGVMIHRISGGSGARLVPAAEISERQSLGSPRSSEVHLKSKEAA